MMKTHIAACLMATALATAPVFAQDRPTSTGSGSTTSGSPAMNPGATGSGSAGTGASTAGGAGAGTGASTAGGAGAAAGSSAQGSSTMGAKGGSFVERQQPGQFLASRVVGMTVYGANNERIGDVNDVLMDRDGKAQAIVVGVGGFLGIGEKDVAVQFNAVEFASGDAGRGGTAGTTGGSGGASGSATGTTSGTGTGGGTSGGMATTGGATTAGAGGATGTPDRVIVRMTREQLDQAPQFARLGDNTTGARTTTTNPPGGAPASGTGAGSTTGAGGTGTGTSTGGAAR